MTEPRILEPQCEWTSDDVGDEEAWTVRLTDVELVELDAALRHALRRSDDVLDLTRDNFPLPTLSARLAEIERELIDGRGFVRIRGVDRSAHTQEEMEVLYWGIGTHLGSPWAQNKHGHVLGDVIDHGRSPDDPEARGYQLGGVALPFHCDGADLVGLLSSTTGCPAASRRWPTRSRSTTRSCGSAPTWPPRCTSRSRSATSSGCGWRPTRSTPATSLRQPQPLGGEPLGQPHARRLRLRSRAALESCLPGRSTLLVPPGRAEVRDVVAVVRSAPPPATLLLAAIGLLETRPPQLPSVGVHLPDPLVEPAPIDDLRRSLLRARAHPEHACTSGPTGRRAGRGRELPMPADGPRKAAVVPAMATVNTRRARHALGMAETAAEAVRNAHRWFEHNSGWAPPDVGTLDEWVADGVCRCPDECLVAPDRWCEHGLASWALILADLDRPGRGVS